ncbi:MAG TPA: hypothetical protein PLK67_08035 [Bryobacteraceae bacterium]|nr:hypothetical protein [Bryobacteraceae bacterium]
MIDPSIPLSGRQVQISPLEAYGRTASLASMMQRYKANQQAIEANKLKLEQEKQEMEDRQIMMEEIRRAGGDVAKALEAAKGKVSPKFHADLTSKHLQSQADLTRMRQADLDLTKSKTEGIASLLGSIVLEQDPAKRAALYQQARAAAIERGYATEQEVPAEYPGDEWLHVMVLGSKVGLDYLKREEERRAAQRAQERHDVEMPGIKADAAQKQLSGAAAQLGAARSREEYERIWNNLPAGIARNFPVPEDWNEQTAAQVNQIGMTPAQRATAAGSAESRAEQRRHNIQAEEERKRQTDLDYEQELQKLESEEQKLHELRLGLGQAWSGIYTDPGTKMVYDLRNNKVAKPNGKWEKLNPEQVKAVQARIKSRFRAATERINRIIEIKNKLIQRMGGTPKYTGKLNPDLSAYRPPAQGGQGAGTQQAAQSAAQPVAQPAAAPAAQPSPAPASGQKVAVISPEGVPGMIPADKLEAALQRGFKLRQ